MQTQKLTLVTIISGSILLGGCLSDATNVINSAGTAMAVGQNSSDEQSSDDADRTRREGVVAGMVIGGAAGSLIGDGGTTNTLLGTAVGGGVGYVVGNEVAKRKQAYANKEDLIDAESQRAQELIDEVRSVNSKLRKDIKAFEKQVKLLEKNVSEGKAEKVVLKEQKKSIDKRYKEAKDALNAVEKEIEISENLYADTQKAATADNQADLKKWQKRIDGLKKEKVALEKNTGQLQSVSESISV